MASGSPQSVCHRNLPGFSRGSFYAIRIGKELLGNTLRCYGGVPEVKYRAHGLDKDYLVKTDKARVEYTSDTSLDPL